MNSYVTHMTEYVFRGELLRLWKLVCLTYFCHSYVDIYV